MPNVVRFTLPTARTLYVSGVGSFVAGILDVDANNLKLVAKTRFLVQPYGAVELGTVDSTTPKPSLPAVPGPPNPDPYPQYPTMDEIVASSELRAASGARIAPTSFMSGRRLAFDGDSITVGTGSTNASVNSWVAYTSKILGTANVPTTGTYARINAGVGSDTAALLLARLDGIIAQDPDIHVVMIGQNASADTATYIADITAIIDKIQASRRPLVLCTVTPRSAAAPAGENQRINVYNLALRSIANQRGIPLADTHAALVDPATGALAAAYVGSDTTHPNSAGHLAIAQAVAPVVRKVLPATSLFPVIVPGDPGLVTNPLMAGGGPSTGPTGWSAASSPANGGVRSVGTEAPDGSDILPGGVWYRFTMDAMAATGSTGAVQNTTLAGTHEAGDKILVAAVVKSSDANGAGPKLTLADGSTDLVSIAESMGVQRPGLLLQVATLAATTSNLRLRFSVYTEPGTIRSGYLGACQAWNLRKLNLTNQF